MKLTNEQKARIEADAIQCAKTNTQPIDGCPWPLGSLEGRHWLAVWILNGGTIQQEAKQ